jgi:hypothetical protein
MSHCCTIAGFFGGMLVVLIPVSLILFRLLMIRSDECRALQKHMHDERHDDSEP